MDVGSRLMRQVCRTFIIHMGDVDIKLLACKLSSMRSTRSMRGGIIFRDQMPLKKALFDRD